jgi:hypothetical protein
MEDEMRVFGPRHRAGKLKKQVGQTDVARRFSQETAGVSWPPTLSEEEARLYMEYGTALFTGIGVGKLRPAQGRSGNR